MPQPTTGAAAARTKKCAAAYHRGNGSSSQKFRRRGLPQGQRQQQLKLFIRGRAKGPCCDRRGTGTSPIDAQTTTGPVACAQKSVRATTGPRSARAVRKAAREALSQQIKQVSALTYQCLTRSARYATCLASRCRWCRSNMDRIRQADQLCRTKKFAHTRDSAAHQAVCRRFERGTAAHSGRQAGSCAHQADCCAPQAMRQLHAPDAFTSAARTSERSSKIQRRAEE